ncbi:MAG TPA: TAT-variant-translocated molybdopterin oxidoreductase [Terriglobia bacterium]|nr:TAT-variant-translocated molybdopterin oxidoreductase [Terriglobia bacterium]
MSGKEKPQIPIDLAAVRSALEKSGGKRMWRGLDDLAGSREFQDFRDHEYPYDDPKSRLGVSRRDFLKVAGAATTLLGLTACTKLPVEKIVPYVNAPEQIVPGHPLFYATSMPFQGYGTGLLVESHMGRPTKAEGNPGHPASLGSTDIYAQASLLDMYDPDRAQVVLREGHVGSYSDFLDLLKGLRAEHLAKKGAGLRFLTETVTSPTLADQFHDLLTQFPQAKWHQYEPLARDNARAGAKLAFGEYVETVYHFDQADVVVALDSDFMASGPGAVRYAREFANKRRVTGPDSTMSRFYAVECTPTVTGVQADHRLRLKSGDVEAVARSLAAQLGVKVSSVVTAPAGIPAGWIEAVVRDLQNHKGACVVVAGDHQPPVVHALAHAMNDILGGVGKTVTYTGPAEANPMDQVQSLRDLASDLDNGAVEMLVMFGGNPIYNAPADIPFLDKLKKAKLRIHLSLYDNETAEYCHWHIPAAHYLESWSDARADDGTVGIIQPLIAPLYNGVSAHEILTVLQGQEGRTGHTIVREYWMKQKPGANFEEQWEAWLEKGVVADTALPAKKVALKLDFDTSGGGGSKPGGMEVVFRPDPTVWDGRYANNGWLQELPKPISKLTWDNVASVSPTTAQQLSISNGDVLKVSLGGRSVTAPAWISVGQVDECVVLYLGYGRRRAGRIGTGIGYDAYAIRSSDTPWFASGLQVKKTGDTYKLVTTQHHRIMKENGVETEIESRAAFQRGVMRVGTLEEFKQNPDFAKNPPDETTEAKSLYPPYNYKVGYQWGMSIDLNACIGCNACVIACQAENNIAVVGKDQVSKGREMHWLRVDSYFQGDLDQPQIYSEPVPCMQCENAPCEYVCPVGATVHSPEGLNEMVYNRCVGTRYCSNNCSYKVRHFNFFLYSDWNTPSLFGLRNPDVTVRSRGVMEKCTYCVQRINEVKIKAEESNRTIQDGEIATACEQVCPTKAIVFGDIIDSGSRVAKVKGQSRDYSLLADLNTRPRTTYLAKLRNPNPEIKE